MIMFTPQEQKQLARLGVAAVLLFGSRAQNLAQFHLHRALEGVFNIASHLLSRIPGGQATQYKEMAVKLGEYNIVSKDFAQKQLVEMAKHRNRLVLFYAQVTPKELYALLHDDLGDIETFLSAVKAVLEKPEKFNLTVE